MANLINKKEITATTVESVLEQVINKLNRYGYAVADSDEKAESMFKEWGYDGEMRYDVEQQFELLGEMDGDWQKTISVTIYGNYVDSGSDDYIYTVSVTED